MYVCNIEMEFFKNDMVSLHLQMLAIFLNIWKFYFSNLQQGHNMHLLKKSIWISFFFS